MPPPDRARRWAALVLAIYLAVVVLVSLVPRPLDTGLTPWIRGTLAQMHRGGLPGFISYDVVEVAAHVVLFVPLGTLAVIATGRRLAWLAAIALLAVSVLVELAPSLLGHDHSPSMLDLIMNVAGAVAGAAIGYWALTPYKRAPDAAA